MAQLASSLASATYGSAARRSLLIAAVGASVVAYVNSTVAATAVPAIGRTFELDITGQQWIALTYGLSLASLYLLSGALSDRYGLRHTFLAGAVACAIGSSLAAVSPNVELLLAARLVQGIGGALTTTSALALLRTGFGHESSRAIGSWAGWSGGAALAIAIAAGFALDSLSWRVLFAACVPLTLIAAVLVARAPEQHEDRRVRRLDIAGAVLVTVAVSALIIGLAESRSHLPAATAAGAIALTTLLAFVVRERHAANPLVPPWLFGRKLLRSTTIATLLIDAGIGASLFFLALFMQSGLGFSALRTTLLFAPIGLLMFGVAPRVGKLAERYGSRVVLGGGQILVALGVVLCISLPTPTWPTVLAGIAVLAIGMALTAAPLTSLALQAAPHGYEGTAAAINAAASRLGATLATATVGIVVAMLLPAGTALSISDGGSTVAYRGGLLVAAMLTLAGAGYAATKLPGTRREDAGPTTRPLGQIKSDWDLAPSRDWTRLQKKAYSVADVTAANGDTKAKRRILAWADLPRRLRAGPSLPKCWLRFVRAMSERSGPWFRSTSQP